MSNRLLVPAWLMLSSFLGMPAAPDGGTRATRDQSATTSPYFGQPVPKLPPERFAPGIVSTDAIELNGVFAPDMKEFFFARLIDKIQTMHHSQLVDGVWSTPRPLLLFPGESRGVADDMSVSTDGRELYFLGIHPHAHDGGVRSHRHLAQQAHQRKVVDGGGVASSDQHQRERSLSCDRQRWQLVLRIQSPRRPRALQPLQSAAARRRNLRGTHVSAPACQQ